MSDTFNVGFPYIEKQRIPSLIINFGRACVPRNMQLQSNSIFTCTHIKKEAAS